MKSTKQFYRTAYREIIVQRIVSALLVGAVIAQGYYIQHRDKELCALLNHRRDWLQKVEHRTELAHRAIIDVQYARADYEAHISEQFNRVMSKWYRTPWRNGS